MRERVFSQRQRLDQKRMDVIPLGVGENEGEGHVLGLGDWSSSPQTLILGPDKDGSLTLTPKCQ